MDQVSRVSKSQVRLSIELLLTVVIVISILLRLLNLATREFWYDEVISIKIAAGQLNAYQNPTATPVPLSDYTAWLNLPGEANWRDAVKTLLELLKSTLGGEPHPPLFYLSQHFWLRLFGNSEVAVRSLGALLSFGALLGGYGLGRAVLGHRGGLLLAALLGTNPFYLFHSLNVRMYGPLVLWTTLSACALLHLINQTQGQTARNWRKQFWWTLLLIGSVAAGLMTFYLFAYYLIALGVLVLFLDWRRWWQHGLRLGAGVLLTLPWMLWGAVRQLRNADTGRFAVSGGFGAALIRHLQDVTHVLGINLLAGDWAESISKDSLLVVGLIVISLLSVCALSLWQRREYRLLKVALILGLLPLLIAFAVDTAAGKFTLAWGTGRSMIFILPGCLLLLVAWVERSTGRWQGAVASTLVLLYLTISIGDFSLRQRQDMQTLAKVIGQAPTTPTLIAMSARARGHILRLAYYVDVGEPVALLAQAAPKLIPALAAVAEQYPRIIWLDSAKPVFSDPPAMEQENQQIRQILASDFQLIETQELRGTMPLDHFTMRLYTRRSS